MLNLPKAHVVFLAISLLGVSSPIQLDIDADNLSSRLIKIDVRFVKHVTVFSLTDLSTFGSSTIASDDDGFGLNKGGE